MKVASIIIGLVLFAVAVPASAQDVVIPEEEAMIVSSTPVEKMEQLPRLQPSEQLDSETAGNLDRAEQLAGEEPEEAIRIVLAMLLSHDPFTKRQRDAIKSRVAPILRKAAATLKETDLERAAFASSAAWYATDHQPNPEHAKLLVTLARERASDSEPEALWLARRASKADPNNEEALQLDRQLSRNRLLVPGWVAFFAGVGGIVAGAVFAGSANSITAQLRDGQLRSRAELDDLIAERRGIATMSTFSYLGGIGLMIGSGVVWLVGQRNYRPTSPEYLPAVGY